MTHAEVLVKLRRRVKRCGSQSKAAAAIGVSPVFLSYVLRGMRMPGPRVLRFLGMQRKVRRDVNYVRNGGGR